MACTLKMAVCLVMLTSFVYGSDERPILKETPARLVACVESTARANYVAACVNVTRDVLQKRLKIYAVSLEAKTGKFKEGDFEIEVIYNAELAIEAKTAAGAYHEHNNHMVMAFAAAQFVAGKADLGLRLVRLIAGAQPDLFWTSSTHSPLTIQQILRGLEKNDESVKVFLKEKCESWTYNVKVYGP